MANVNPPDPQNAAPRHSRWGLDGDTVAAFLRRPFVLRHFVQDLAVALTVLGIGVAAARVATGTPRNIGYAVRGAGETATVLVLVTYGTRRYRTWTAARLARVGIWLDRSVIRYLHAGVAGSILYLLSEPGALFEGSALKIVPLLFAAVGYVAGVRQLVDPRRLLRAMVTMLPWGWLGPFVYAAEFLVCSAAVFTFVTASTGAEFSGTPAASIAPHRIAEFYLWHCSSAVPLVDVPETLKWPEPLAYTSPAIGVGVLVFTVSVGATIVALIRTHLMAARNEPPPAGS